MKRIYTFVAYFSILKICVDTTAQGTTSNRCYLFLPFFKSIEKKRQCMSTPQELFEYMIIQISCGIPGLLRAEKE